MIVMDLIFILSAAVTILYAIDVLGIHPSDSRGYPIFWTGRFIAGLGIGAETAIIPTYLGGLHVYSLYFA